VTLNLAETSVVKSRPSVPHGANVLSFEVNLRWTCDQQVVCSDPTHGKSCVRTLGKLFTPMCLCHQAV